MKKLELFHFFMNGDIKEVQRFLKTQGVSLKTEQILGLRNLLR